ncbi:MAG: MnhB domain-containing protein [Actinomycetota bacterium]
MIATRSPVVRIGVQVASPLALLVATFLLFAGHNRPGGGFAAGLLLGAVVALRTAAGLQRPTRALGFLGAGGVLTGLVAVAPLLWGDGVLDQIVVEETFPVLGTVKSGSALPFDIGVTLIVVGMVIAVLDGFGVTDEELQPEEAGP